MKVRVSLYLLVVLLLVSNVNAFNTPQRTYNFGPGKCFSDSVYDSNYCRSGNICYGVIDDTCTGGEDCPGDTVQENHCAQGLECFDIDNDGTYCIPEVNGCVYDNECSEGKECSNYQCKEKILFGEIISDSSTQFCAEGLYDNSGICDVLTTTQTGFCYSNSECPNNFVCSSSLCKNPEELGLSTGFPDGGVLREDTDNSASIKYLMNWYDLSEETEFTRYYQEQSLDGHIFNVGSSMSNLHTRISFYMKIHPGKIISPEAILNSADWFADDYFSLSMYDVSTGRREVSWSYFHETNADDWERTYYPDSYSDGIIPFTIPSQINNEPKWYKFVASFQNYRGGRQYANVGFKDDLSQFVSRINGVYQIDSGRFTDADGMAVSVPGRLTNEVNIGSEAQGFSFLMSPGEKKVITTDFDVEGFVASCENSEVKYFKGTGTKSKNIFLENTYRSGDKVQCSVFAWSENFQPETTIFDFVNVEDSEEQTISVNKDFPLSENLETLISCSGSTLDYTFSAPDEVLPDVDLKFSRSNFSEDNNCAIISLMDGSADMLEGTIELETLTIPDNSQYSYNGRRFVFGFDIDGAVVRCKDSSSWDEGMISTRYAIGDGEVMVYSQPGNDCSVFAWEGNYYDPNAPEELEECPVCNELNEGTICTQSGVVSACVYHYNDAGILELSLVDINSYANSAFARPYGNNIDEVRNDIVSSYDNFFMCNALGNYVIPPPNTESCTEFTSEYFDREITLCSSSDDEDCCTYNGPVNYEDIGQCLDECRIINEDSGNNDLYSNQDLCEKFADYGLSCNEAPSDDITICNPDIEGDCDPPTGGWNYCPVGEIIDGQKITECSEGCKYDLFTSYTNKPFAEAETYCCAADPALDQACEVAPECPNNNWFDYTNGLQECSGIAEEMPEGSGNYCCINGTIDYINIPSNYKPVSCNIIDGQGIGFSCDYNSASPDPQELFWGMSTGKITDKTILDVSEIIIYPNYYNGQEELIVYLPEGDFTRNDWSSAEFVEFDFKIYPATINGDETFNFDPTNFYLKVNDQDVFLARVSDFMLKGINDVYKIKIPLINGLDYSNVQSIGVGTNDLLVTNSMRFSLDNINLIDLENPNLLCGYKGFVEDPDIYNPNSLAELKAAKFACEVPGLTISREKNDRNPLSWTGTQCCGDDIYYETLTFNSGVSEGVNYLPNPDFSNNLLYDSFDLSRTDVWQIWTATDFVSGNTYVPEIVDSSLKFGNWKYGEAHQVINVNSELQDLLNSGDVYFLLDHNWEIPGIVTTGASLDEITITAYNLNPYIIVWSETFSLNSPVSIPVYKRLSAHSENVEKIDVKLHYSSRDDYGQIFLNINEVFLGSMNSGSNTIISNTPSFEYYKDFDACFAGSKVPEGQSVGYALNNDDYDDLLYADGGFRLCDFYNEGLYSDYKLTDNEGAPTQEGLVDQTITSCQNYGAYTCTGDGWSNQRIVFDLEMPMQGFDIDTTVYCEDGILVEPELKPDWYLNDSGGCFVDSCYCPFDECQEFAQNSCVPNGTSVNNRYCEGGTWTTRTSYAAQLIVEKMGLSGENGRDGLLSCGLENEIVNSQVSNTFTDACFYSNLEERPKDRVFIVALPLTGNNALQKFLEDEFAEIYDNVVEGEGFNITECLSQMSGDLWECDAGEIENSGEHMTIYFDPEMKIVYVANSDVLSSGSNWLEQFWRDLFNIGGDYPTLSTDFDQLYLYRKGNNYVDAYTNTFYERDIRKIVDHRDVIISFENKTKESELANYVEEAVSAEISTNTDSTRILWNDKNSLWNLITATSRYQLD